MPRKSHWSMRWAAYAALLMAALAATAAPCRAQGDADDFFVAQVASVSGVLEAAVGENGPFTSLAAGSRVKDGQRLRTSADGRAEIHFDAGEILVIGPNSDITVKARPAGSTLERLVSIFLSDGLVRALFGQPSGGGFEVRTDLVIAAARSTQWIVTSDGGESAVFIEEGAVDVAGQGAAEADPIVLREGEGVTVTATGGVSAPQTWAADRVEALKARLD